MTDMIVANAENSAANGTYVENGTQNGKPKYTKSGASIKYINYWTVAADDSSFSYEALDGEFATPDLATGWFDFSTFSPSAITVTAASAGGAFIPINMSAQMQSLAGGFRG